MPSIPKAYAAAKELVTLLVPSPAGTQEVAPTAPPSGTEASNTFKLVSRPTSRGKPPFIASPEMSPWCRSLALGGSAPLWSPWSSSSASSSSSTLDLGSNYSRRRHRRGALGSGMTQETWPRGPCCPAPLQWPFWNPWGLPPGQGTGSCYSYSVRSETIVAPGGTHRHPRVDPRYQDGCQSRSQHCCQRRSRDTPWYRDRYRNQYRYPSQWT